MAYFRGSTTALTKNASWTSGVGLRERHDTVTGAVFADVGGTLHIEQSADGVNWDVDASYTVTGNAGTGFKENLVLPYWRIRYANGGSDQTTFRINASTQGGGDS